MEENMDDSEIFFGGYNETRTKDKTIDWVANVDEKKWAVNVSSMKIGDKEVKLQHPKLVLDSFESNIRISKSILPLMFLISSVADFDYLDTLLRQKFSCLYDSVHYMLVCEVPSDSYDPFPTITFVVENKLTLKIEPKDYIIFVLLLAF